MVSQILSGYTSEPEKRSALRHCLGDSDYWTHAVSETGLRFDGEGVSAEATSDRVHGERLLVVDNPSSFFDLLMSKELVDEDQLVGRVDFRDQLDEPDRHCRCDQVDADVCPCCRHPEMMEGEILLFRALPVLLYHELRLKTKRSGIAYTDTGMPIASSYCAVFIDRSEIEELILRLALPMSYFQQQ